MLWVLIRSASVLMSTHSICFYGEIRKISQNYHQMLLLNNSSANPFLHIILLRLMNLYNSKFILTATSLKTNDMVVTGIHCTVLSEFRNHGCWDVKYYRQLSLYRYNDKILCNDNLTVAKLSLKR